MRAKRISVYPVLYGFSFLKNLQFFGSLAVPFYLQRLGMDYTRMFLLETVFSVFLFLFEVPTGVIADRAGRKVSLFCGALLFGGSFFIYGFARSLWVLVLMQVVCALGFSMISGADHALVYEVSRSDGKDEAGTAAISARYDAAGTAGMLVAFPCGSLFATSGILPYTSALGAVFCATGICLILSGFLVITVPEKIRIHSGTSALQHGLDGFRMIFHNPDLRLFSLNYAVISALTFFMFWFYQSLLMKNHFPVVWFGFVAAGFNGGGMLLLLGTDVIRKKFGTANILFFSSVVPGILYITVFLWPGLPSAFAAIFGITMLRFFRAPLLTTIINTKIGDENRATVLSGISMVERMIVALFYPFAGILSDISLELTLLGIGVLTVLLAIFLRTGSGSTGK
jgi:MFS family permease